MKSSLFPDQALARKIDPLNLLRLDSYDAEMSELCERLEELPIIPITEDDRAAIEEAIRSSDNVVRFPTHLRKEKPREE
jgi:hypothetical protein